MTIFLDCDGVLANFDQAFHDHFGMPPRRYEELFGPMVFWGDIRSRVPDFYRHLPMMPDATRLHSAIVDPVILTGVPQGGWAESQKIDWANDHFPGTKIICCKAREKFKHCAPGDVLIDDTLKYANLWKDAGGIFIHHTSAEKSLEILAGVMA